MALMFTLAFVTAQSARLGGPILAANAVLLNFQHLTSFGLDGIAHAAEALVGKAVGEKRRDALVHSVNLTLKWSVIFALGFTACYLILGRQIIGILTDLPDIRDTAIRYLPWMIASPLVSVWCFLYDGVYIGATCAREMRNIMVSQRSSCFCRPGIFCSHWVTTACGWRFYCLWAPVASGCILDTANNPSHQ